MLLGVGAVATKTYVDDVFSTYLYKGNSTARSITNNINLTDNEGMVWIKNRSTGGSDYHSVIQDTIRGAGATKKLCSSSNNYENSGKNQDAKKGYISAFNNNGFSLGKTGTDTGHAWSAVNKSTDDYAAWTLLKKPGFLDIVTYTGNGTAGHQIAHELGCMPGMVIVKRRSGGNGDWLVWHRGVHPTDAGDYFLSLDTDSQAYDNSNIWNDTNPTATHFTVGGEAGANANGAELVAYVFAGGESTAATATSVVFDGSGDYLSLAASSDFAFGTGDYTVECWIKPENLSGNLEIVFASGGTSSEVPFFLHYDENQLSVGNYWNMVSNQATTFNNGQWYHIAACRSGSTLRLFKNGIQVGTDETDNNNWTSTGTTLMGRNTAGGQEVTGGISNFRVVKGTALYTSSFEPPTEPLTNITNTKLLCCNNSSTTGSTVTPGTITANGDPTASTDSPFDDPAGFVFGEGGDQNVISTGSYIGNGSSTGPEINLGFEPQYILIKKTSGSGDWTIFDSMRGIVTGGNENYLHPNSSDDETTGYERVDLTSTGFKITDGGWINDDGGDYVYMAIRRSDGYVGKPPELGTDVFAMDTGNSSSTIPCFDSGFPVDFAFFKKTASTGNWFTGGRLIGENYLYTNDNNSESSMSSQEWDSNVGYQRAQDDRYQAWMWKRHAGFDVVTYKGNSTGSSTQTINHSLGKAPEMIWVKNRDSSFDWPVAHKGLNGGTTPWNYSMFLNNTDANNSSAGWFNNTAPTSTVFTVGVNNAVNKNGDDIIAMLFASVDGISKVGSYTGNGSTQTITTGFQPRFLIIRRTDSTEHWWVLDTTRGWGSGNDQYISLNTTSAQSAHDFGAPTSTGFSLPDSNGSYNGNTNKYIYYAHA